MWIAPGVDVPINNLAVVIYFGTMGSVLLALLGILTGIWADKFDHAAAVTNFIIQPLTLLSGTFYAIDKVSPVMRMISHANPFFYVIDGFPLRFPRRVRRAGAAGRNRARRARRRFVVAVFCPAQVGVAAAPVILLAAALVAAAAAPWEVPQRSVAIPGGRHLNLYCTGRGGPTVLLEAGFGATTWAWAKVQPLIAKTNRVCSYDRAGMGFSPAGPMPRDGTAIVADLDALVKGGAALLHPTSSSVIRQAA